MNLARTQALFWRAISWPTGIDDFLAQASAEDRAAFEATFAQTPGFGRRERMQVYAEAYFYRLLDVLTDQFAVTQWLCTPSHFHNLATDYVLQCPSVDPDIRAYGARLPEFIANHAQGARVPGLASIATIEWAIVSAVDAADGAVLRKEDLAEIPVDQWPTLRFQPAATTSLHDCPLQFSELYVAHDAEETPPSPPEQSPSTVLVWRQRLTVYQRTPPAAEARALRSMLDGETFAQICDAAAGEDGTGGSPADVAQWLQRWLEAELITGVAR